MVKVLVGNIFDSKAQTLVNTVNCVGVMGKGIALEFKKRYPDMYRDYVDRCKRGQVVLGEPYLYKSLVFPWILNFPTKDHWRSLANLDNISAGLDYLLSMYEEWGITSLAVPPLGSGLGQLEWRASGPLIYRRLSKMNAEVELYAPYGTPLDELQASFLANDSARQFPLRRPNFEWITPEWFALVEILNRVESQRHHPPVGRVGFQKMAYLAKVAGLPLDIEFAKGEYGPYSPELKRRINRLQSNKLIKEQPFGRMVRTLVDSSYHDTKRFYLPEINKWEAQIARVSDLFMRINTEEAEVIATIVFVAEELKNINNVKPTEVEVCSAVISWKKLRNPPFEEKRIAYAIRNLAARGWLDVQPSNDLNLDEDIIDV